MLRHDASKSRKPVTTFGHLPRPLNKMYAERNILDVLHKFQRISRDGLALRRFSNIISDEKYLILFTYFRDACSCLITYIKVMITIVNLIPSVK